MEIISKKNLNDILSVFDDKIYDNINNDMSILKKESYDKLDDIYKINDNNDNLSLSKKSYFLKFIDNYYDNKIKIYNQHIKNKENIIERLDKLKLLKLPEQRSQEWYDMREKILTASSLADAIGEGHFSTKEQLLIQKCGGPRGNVPFEIVEWGVMYEPVATEFYESLKNVTVLEFGLVPHPEFEIFGASPDGICDSTSSEECIGRMLEIKCPPKRQFTKEVPKHYWMQMQGQLETCDLEECDFLQVKFIEYFTENDYIEDVYLENSIVKEGVSNNNLPKGLLIAFIKNNLEGNPTIKYEYAKLYSSYDELKKWADNILNSYKISDYQYDTIKFHWWKIERYECTLVYRDREWWLDTQPKIIDFWEDVLHYRKIGIQSLLDKKEEKKNKKIKNKKKIYKNSFNIDKEIVEQIQNTYLIDSD